MLRYTTRMIKSFRHRGVEALFENGSKAGIQPPLALGWCGRGNGLSGLKHLDRSNGPEDMNVPGWRLHLLEGKLANHWSVWVNGNWRLAFSFDGEDAVLVDYQDYH